MKLKLNPVRILLIFMVLFSFRNGAIASRIYGGVYTKERIANLRDNCDRYDWARKQRNAYVANAKYWLAKEDVELWDMVPGQDLPRCIDVTFDRLTKGPKFLGCLKCGEKISRYGNYPYHPDFENKPWKLTCPACQSVFPTNDFGKYYKSGIDAHGLFNPAKADKGLLYNFAHPDPNDPLHKYGVDDGFGYIDKNGRSYKFIGYYTWKYWREINNGLNALADAYLYTGDKRYAYKAAILLDRIADIYPSMNWEPYANRGWYHSDGGSSQGKIEGSIWETNFIQRFADAYDKILSGTNDAPDLYKFLKQQSEKYQLPNVKGTRDLFVNNVDNGILRTAFNAVLSKQIRGNQGMHQLTVTRCALALNTNPETTQWLDWLFTPNGGAIPGLMVNNFDRDGTSDEGAPGYAYMWGHLISQLGGLLADYPGYTKHDIFREFPQFNTTFMAPYRMSLLGIAIPNIGDSGSTGLVSKEQVNPDFIAQGYFYTRDPQMAIAAYRANGNSASGLGLDIYSKDPESLGNEIKQIAEKAPLRTEEGHLMSGFGLASLEIGKGKSGIGLVSNYGRTIKHAHPDLLNFDLLAFGNWMAPDHGYPEYATRWPSNNEWTGSTLSHNLVFVNKKPQQEVWGGHTRMFKQLKGFGAFELDGRKAYPDLKAYSRTMLLIGADEEKSERNAYVIDIFNVKGGYDHVYSFHGPPGTLTNVGLTLENQPTGSYAGADILKGTLSKDFPIGYSHLYHVKRDAAPPKQFVLDWKAEAGYHNVGLKDDMHLRMHALSQSDDVALADGDPPQNKAGNPKTLNYVLMHRTAPDLNSTFVTVIEPYRKIPFIKSVKRLDKGKGDEVYIQVEHVDGSIDYVLFNPSTENTVRLSNGISMNGKMGYIREKDGKAVKGILINGTGLQYKKIRLKSTGAITGQVLKMNKGLEGGGWLVVDAELPIDGSMTGEQLIVETETERDASYTIKSVVREGGQTKVNCGPISFVRSYKHGFAGSGNQQQGDGTYEYDFKEGATFQITAHKIWVQ